MADDGGGGSVWSSAGSRSSSAVMNGFPILFPAGPLDQSQSARARTMVGAPTVRPASQRRNAGRSLCVERARQLTNHERLPRRHLGSLICRRAARMLDQELDECLPALPAIDATTQIRIERDRALEKPQRNARVPEPARVHQRATDHDPLIRSFCVVALRDSSSRARTASSSPSAARTGSVRGNAFFRASRCSIPDAPVLDHVLPRRAVDRRAGVDQHLGGNRPGVDALALRVRAVHRVGRGGVEQRLATLVAPRDQRRVFSQQRSQPLVVLVVNRDLGLRSRPLERAAQAFLHLGRQIRPAGESVFARDDELRIPVRERERAPRQLRVDASDGFAVSGSGVACKFFRLLAKGVERGTGGQISEQRTWRLLSRTACTR